MTQEDANLLVSSERNASRWRNAHQHAWHDLKTRWRRGLFWTLCLFIFIGLVLSLALVLKYAANATLGGATACRPDGAFSLEPYEFNYWDASGFFQVTLGYGRLTFSQAKGVDVLWDVVSIEALRLDMYLD